MTSKMSVQVTLRIDPAEYDRITDAAARAGLSVPMWLIRCASTAAAAEAAEALIAALTEEAP